MRRHECMMCEVFEGKIYCSYYDLMYMPCENNPVCPEGLDDEDEDGDEYGEDIFDDDERYDKNSGLLTEQM